MPAPYHETASACWPVTAPDPSFVVKLALNVPASPRMIGLPPLGVAVPVLVTVAETLNGFAETSSSVT